MKKMKLNLTLKDFYGTKNMAALISKSASVAAVCKEENI